ncbi:MAG: putative RND superfamily exporter protein [Gammaproteobacteria bacterium]
MISKFLDSFVDHPYVVLGLALIITCFALNETIDLDNRRVNIAVDSSIENLLPADGPKLKVYAETREKFVGDDVLIVVWLADDLFSPERLAALKRLTGRLKLMSGIEAVDSLASATYIRAEDEFTEVSPFLDTLPTTLEEALSLKQDALDNPLYIGTLVSQDGRGTMLAVRFDPALDTTELGAKVDAISAASKEEADGIQQFVTGPIVARLETGRTLFSDVKLVFPLAVLATLLVSLVGLRSVPGVLLPLLINGFSLLITITIFIQCGYALNFVTVIMPPVVFVVGFAYSVHVVSDFESAMAAGYERIAAIKHAVNDVFMPLTLTAFTTGVGFVSLMTSNIDTIKVFGAFCAIGTILSWICAVSLVPAGLRLLPSRKPKTSDGGFLLRLAPKLSKFDLDNRKAILISGFAIAMVSVFFASKIKVGTDYLHNFPDDSEIRRNFEEIGKTFSGAVPLQVLIRSDVPNVFKNPEELHELDKLQTWLKQQPEIGGVVSFVDYMRMLHLTFVPDITPENSIPGSYNLSDQLLALGANDDVERFSDVRYKNTLMHVQSTSVSSDELIKLVERIEKRLAELPEHLRGKVTGSSVLLAQTMDEITRGQVISLSGALLIIYLILSILFGSLRVGAVALIPNLLPIAAFFGILGATGITLNLATSLVATVALGIAVDDSIHYFSRFNTESRRLANEQLGVARAIAAIIRPVTFTTAALCAGFLALLISDLQSQVEFGVLAAMTLFLAWLVDLTLSPALSSGLRFVTLWEVLTVDLGTEPNKKIGLFKGLTDRQARIAALFGRIEPYGPGDRIISFGEQGHDICILIEGVVVVQVSRPEGNRVLRALHPGEVFGEVALFTGKRSADIDAMTDVRVLWLNQESLERIQSRYPAIAAQLFWNLTGTVAHRLADITSRV